MQHRKTENSLSLLGGALAGAAVMYFLDPDNGDRRRHVAGEAAGETFDSAGNALGRGWDAARVYGSSLAGHAGEYSSQLADHARNASVAAAAGLASGAGSLRESRPMRAAGGWANELLDRARGFGSDVSDGAARQSHRARHAAAQAIDADVHHTNYGGYAATGAGTLAIGAAMMYFLDPTRGGQRRTRMAREATRICEQTGTAFRETGSRIASRLRQRAGQAQSVMQRGDETDGEHLLQRVRAQVSQAISRPAEVQLMADAGGVVTIYGRVPASEADKLLSTVSGVTGVRRIINRTEVQDITPIATATLGSGQTIA